MEPENRLETANIPTLCLNKLAQTMVKLRNHLFILLAP